MRLVPTKLPSLQLLKALHLDAGFRYP